MTHPDGAIFSANSEACRLLNRTEEEIFRIGYKGVVEMNHDFLKAIKERKQTGCFHGELNFVHANGTVFPAEVESCFYTDPKGKLHSYIFFQDISERKRTESEIKIKNNELSRLLDEKDKFFSILAHDLRNPFNAFLGFTQLLSEDLPNMSLPEIQKIALILKNTATNVYGLLENLLEWSKIQRGISDFNPKSFLLRTKIDGSLPLVIESANKKEIKIGFDIPDDMMVTADPNMFDSIVRNLTTNAVKFTPKGRKITLSAKPAPNNFVEISVRDNGIGMEKDLCSKLFSLDKHTGHKGTEGESSSGLGLSICKDFVEKHHGSIWAESEKGKGSTFYFTLPGGI
jgi:PAS domain S-box-containing protein